MTPRTFPASGDLQQDQIKRKAGYVEYVAFAQQGGAASMALDDIVRGIEILLEVSASRSGDIHAVEGRIS